MLVVVEVESKRWQVRKCFDYTSSFSFFSSPHQQYEEDVLETLQDVFDVQIIHLDQHNQYDREQ